MRVVSIPMRTRFRGITVREVALLESARTAPDRHDSPVA